MAWISLIVAGLFEMFGVLMINKLHKDSSSVYTITPRRNWVRILKINLRIG